MIVDSSMHHSNDLEKEMPSPTTNPVGHHPLSPVTTASQGQMKKLPGPFRRLQQLESWMDTKIGIEVQGIERIPEEQKQPPPRRNLFLLWGSLNMHVGVITLGLLGPELGLSLRSTIAACMIGIVVGALGSAFNATLGPITGLRQIGISRFSFGIWGARLCSVLNLIVIGGFFVVALIIMGQLLNAVADYNLSVAVGIILVAVISYLISVFGYRFIQVFETYSWIVTFVLLCVLLGQAAPYVNTDAPSQGASSLAITGTFLSVLAVNMSNAIGWSTIASDYTVNYKATTSRVLVFSLVYFGLVIFTTFPVVVGAVIGNVALGTPDTPYFDAFVSHGVGGLIREIYHPLGWSKFALVLLSFSALGNGVAITYSAGLSAQFLGEYFRAVPRFLCSLLFIIIVAVIAIAGQDHLFAIVLSFVSIVGYWAVAFVVFLLLEDQVFRKRRRYNLESWNTQKELPHGFAAVFALLTGYLAGGLPGLAQTWYVGPIAAKLGPYGGDVGMWMVFAVTFVVYLVARPIELHYFKR